MSSKSPFYKPKIIKLYNLDEFEPLIEGLQVAACMLSEPQQLVDEKSVIKRLSVLTLESGVQGTARCSCCGVGPFESRAQQTAHYKHHWHAYNLKRRLFGRPPLTLHEFTSRPDDNSSVSGSDTDLEGNVEQSSDLFSAVTRHCKAVFTNEKGRIFTLYRCILHHRKEDLSTDGDGKQWVNACKDLIKPMNQTWAVLMVSGGHFAGAIFKCGASIKHKTMHSYVVRRGQGHAQGTRDSQGNAPRSAGASLRRYNQEQFILHIQEILTSWTEDLKECCLVLYRAVGPINQGVLFGKASPITRDDPRLRAFPFPTRKPTYKEVQRAFSTVTSVEIYESMEQFQKNIVSASPPFNKPADRTGSRKAIKPVPSKQIDRAKSREPVARELPTQTIISSEDEEPRFTDEGTPKDWIKTLQQCESSDNIQVVQLNDSQVMIADSNTASEVDDTSVCELNVQRSNDNLKKSKRKPKSNKTVEDKSGRKLPVKIPSNVKRMWKVISSGDMNQLTTIVEEWGESEPMLIDAINMADPTDGNTALHKAAITDIPLIVTAILNSGGDPCIRNHQLQTPYVAASKPDTRTAFRLFQGQHPDKYNYAKAHIPGPLTPELIEEEKERKAMQKKAKRQREKIKQVEKLKTNTFRDMTDCEKIKAPEPRCFLCGSKLPETPFQYDDYKFCNIKCLQHHRNIRPLNLTI